MDIINDFQLKNNSNNADNNASGSEAAVPYAARQTPEESLPRALGGLPGLCLLAKLT